MLQMHSPSGAVEQKMRNDGLSEADVDRFFGRASENAGPTASPSDPRFAKYFKMRKMHIPDGAIVRGYSLLSSSNVTKNSTRASRSNTGTENDS